MQLIDIDITWKADEELHPDAQEWHEHFVNNFKTEFEKWLLQCGVRSFNITAINLFYYPEIQKFTVISIS